MSGATTIQADEYNRGGAAAKAKASRRERQRKSTMSRMPNGASTTSTDDGWVEANFAAFVQPGLYMVSVNVNAAYSFEEFDPWFERPGIGIPRPSVLSLVAGGFALASSFDPNRPEYISYGFGAPAGYFWTDVRFTPSY